jgi:hypothetical protein
MELGKENLETRPLPRSTRTQYMRSVTAPGEVHTIVCSVLPNVLFDEGNLAHGQVLAGIEVHGNPGVTAQ